ncbi:MAG: hypothetical protein WA960_00225, partial [Tunicatimonas sp.]
MSKLFQPYSQSALSELSQQELIAIVLEQQAGLSNPPESGSPPKIAYAHDDFCRQIAKNFPNGAVAILDKNLKYLYTAGEAL